MRTDALSVRLSELIYPVFQAIVDKNGSPLYYEACARTHNGLRGDSHMAFLCSAEETGFIDLIDHTIAEQAIEIGLNAGQSVGVNASVFTVERNPDSYLKTLSAARKMTNGLVVEITETVQSKSLHDMIQFVRRARAIGAHIAIDDFGTGKFTVEDVIAFRPNILKVALSRVHAAIGSEAARQWVVDAVALAESVGACVVAEGIESAGQMSLMTSLGVTFFQGHYLAKPSHLLPRVESAPASKRRSGSVRISSQYASGSNL